MPCQQRSLHLWRLPWKLSGWVQKDLIFWKPSRDPETTESEMLLPHCILEKLKQSVYSRRIPRIRYEISDSILNWQEYLDASLVAASRYQWVISCYTQWCDLQPWRDQLTPLSHDLQSGWLISRLETSWDRRLQFHGLFLPNGLSREPRHRVLRLEQLQGHLYSVKGWRTEVKSSQVRLSC